MIPSLKPPLLNQIRSAGPGSLFDDSLAGLITAILLIPQGMAYAMLAGLPAELGLYASILPPIVYALFGSSRSLAVGPVAVASLMVADTLSSQFMDSAAQALTGAVILAAETGLILLAMAALRLGRFVSFISHPVLSGFTIGAAILILISQLAPLLGLSSSPGNGLEKIQGLVGQLTDVHWQTFGFGASAVIFLLLTRNPLIRWLENRGVRRYRAQVLSRVMPLAVVVATIVTSATMGAEQAGVEILGKVAPGLPEISFGFFATILVTPGWLELLPSAFLIALIGYVESVSVAKILAVRRRERVHANRELAALGLSNIAAASVGTMPVAGGFSRSVVNADAGAQSQRAGIITATVIAAVALYATNLFYDLPNAVLSAIIIVAVVQLIDLKGSMAVWRYDHADGLSLGVTAVAVLLVGLEAGLMIGLGISLFLYLWRTSQPHIAVVGLIPDTEHFRNIARHSVQTLDNTLFIRVDENLYFANTNAVEDFVLSHVASDARVRRVVLLMGAVSYIDSSALEMLERLNLSLHDASVVLHLAEIKGPVMDRLSDTEFYRLLQKRNRVHLSGYGAWQALSQ